jgi:hypothetical protein
MIKQSILDRITDLGTETVEKTLLAQIYGKPGEGKTVLAVGLARYICPPEKDVLYLDTREGWVSLENHPELLNGVLRLRVEQFADVVEVANLIRTGQLNAGAVVIDENSTLAEIRLEELIRDTYGVRPGQQTPSDFDPKLYKPMGDDIIRILNTFQGLGVHTIITAHERETVDHRKVKTLKPDYTPKAGAGIQKVLHLSAHLSNQITGSGKNTKYERLVQSHPSALIDAKSRIGGLPLSTDTGTFVQTIHDWLFDETVGLLPTDATGEIAPDELPSEGVPVADTVEADDETVDA